MKDIGTNIYTTYNSFEAAQIVAAFEDAGIPAYIKEDLGGQFVRILAGTSHCATRIYVPEASADAALDILIDMGFEEPIDDQPQAPEIDTVIFDIGNVLMGFPWHEYLDSLYDKEMAERIEEAMTADHRWDNLDLGIMSPEEILDLFINSDPEIEDNIRYVFANIGDAMLKCDYAVPWVKAVKEQGFRVLFLSNYSYYLRELKPEVLGFIPYMDGGVFSCEVHLIKPDKAIYQTICDKYSLDPAKCLFIDDNTDNIRVAKEFGLNAVLFEGYEKTRAEVDRILRK
ncbi:MAG: hypothetical protein E7233_04270 [Lachnospiraceae bacterium]|nr:hypothetical protein [Lachnospiraceae bacterium]